MNKHGLNMVRTGCLTYNHERYILDAMKGFVLQQTTFPVVYTIVDDASTDKTPEVLRQFVDTYFDLNETNVAYEKDTDYGHVTFARHKTNKNCYFAVIYLKENHYSQRKSKALYLTEWMDTKYVALCEGDDYWTDPLKLQKQVDYLEAHDNCCMTAHTAYWEKEGQLSIDGCHYKEERDLTTEEVIRFGGLYLATCSLVFREALGKDWPEWRKMANVGDFPLQILGTLRGRLHFFPQPMSVYRYQREGSWTKNYSANSIEYARNKIKWFESLNQDTNDVYEKVICHHLSKWYRLLFFEKELSFKKYYHAGTVSEEKYNKRVIKDCFIRDFGSLYDFYQKTFVKCKMDGEHNNE